jgi:hypothetical protein
MKNFAKFLGIIAAVAVIGFSMTACGEEEEKKDGGLKFDSALYGDWTGSNGGGITLSSYNDAYGKWVNDYVQLGSFQLTLLTKKGSTYTIRAPYAGDDDPVITAGSDGKLTISGFTGNLSGYNATYTKQP